MGAASAKAQGLKGPITSGDKLRMQSEHIVYLLVDRESNAGRGSVVGLLKMGKKNLFLLDRQGEQVTTMVMRYVTYPDSNQNDMVLFRPTKRFTVEILLQLLRITRGVILYLVLYRQIRYFLEYFDILPVIIG